MKTKTAIAVVAVGLMAGALGLAWRQVRSAAAAEGAATALRQKDAALQAAAKAATARLAVIESQRLELEAKLRELTASANRASSARPAVMALDPKIAAAMEAIARVPWREVVLEKNPELQARYLATRRTELTAQYEAFWAARRLTESQIERFQAIMTEATARDLDLKSTMRGEALDESDPAITKLRDESEERTRAAQRELLGDADYGRLLDYERALPVRDFVDNLTSALVFMDAPLGGAQADRLTQVLADANEAYRQSGNAESLGPNLDAAIRANLPAREVVDSAKVLEQARPFLSPPQYERLEAELLRLRLLNQVWNVVRQTPGEPIIGFVFGRQ